MLLKDFNQIFLSTEEKRLLRNLEREPIFFEPGDSRLPAASVLERYRLINLNQNPTATRINSDGRDYLKWLKQTKRDKIIRWAAWVITTSIALATFFRSGTKANNPDQTYHSNTLQNNGRIIQEVITDVNKCETTDVIPDPNPPITNSTP